MINIQDFNKQFRDNKACLEWLFRERYGKPKCPKCGKINRYHRQGESSHFICACGAHQLSPKKDTIFEKSDTDLFKWFFALYLFSVSKNGVSAKELQRQLKVTYKCAWRIGAQIRKLFAEYNLALSGEVEADETYIGGRRRGKRGRGADGKTVVFGTVQRKGKIKAVVVGNVKAKTLLPIIQGNVQRGARLITDEMPSYRRVKSLGYMHGSVRHAMKEYVRGTLHTNNIEGFWSQLKRSINGTYHAVSPKHLQSYVDEFSYRYNRRQSEQIFDTLMARAGRLI